MSASHKNMSNKNREHGKPTGMSIALCMIVKDEGKNLTRCINSVRGLVSEINIVDTGSSDNTVQLAKSLGANVRREQWTNDFSSARNSSLEMARADWILALDADEALSRDAFSKISAAIRRPDVDGYVLPTRNYMDNSSAANFVPNEGSYEPARAFKGWVESRKVRLFRRRSGIRFEGEIHEVIGPSIKRAGGKTQFLDIPVHHFGFLASEISLKEKTEKMAALAEAKCKSRSGNYQAHYELGVILAQLGDIERAEGCFRQAIALRKGFPLAHYDLAVVLARAGREEEAVSEYHATIELDPDNSDALCNLAVCLQKLDREKEAEKIYRLLLERHPRDARAWNNMGALLASAGNLAEAQEAFETAVRIEPSFSLSIKNLESIMALRAQQSSAKGSPSPGRRTLGLIMIVKNEQNNLNEMLPAIAPSFDEIIIVDTGSQDSSVEIAGTFTNKVFSVPWTDDFSAARNFALSKARAQWILWLDADDRMRPEDVAAIRQYTSNANKAYLLKVSSSTGDSGTAEFIQIRLFRNVEGIEWEGRIHEQILPSLKRKGMEFELLPGVTIVHTGYDKADVLKQKTLRNIGLMEKELESGHDDPNVLHHLAQAYAMVGDLDRAIEISESLLRVLDGHPKSEFMTSAANRLIQCHIFKGNIHAASDWAERLLTMDSQNRLGRYFMGEICYRKGLFHDAADWFTRFCETEEAIGLVAVPWSALNANAHNYLGLAYGRMGRREKARSEFRIAVELGGRVEAYKNLALACMEEGDAAEAESVLRTAIDRGYADADLWTNLGVALARTGKFDEAGGAFRKALELDASNSAALQNLARLESMLRCDLSLNMIVRDEERNLREVLAPIANLFDEIVIVDTGSRDSTCAVAAQFGARIIHQPWTDNFADARNGALNSSRGKWIFWLDADDRIEPQAVKTIRKFIARGTPCGVFFPLESVIGGGQVVQNYTLRLFPNMPGIQWKGAVHEQIADGLRAHKVELVNCPDFIIRHIGYENEAEALKKNLRNLNLLAKELATRPEDPYVLLALAQAFLFFGQEEHAAKWLNLLWKLREKTVASGSRDIFWMAALMLSDCAAKVGSSSDARTWLEQAIELSPSNWIAYFILGEQKLLEGETDEAARLFGKTAEIGITPTLLPLDINAIKEKLEGYLRELRPTPVCNQV